MDELARDQRVAAAYDLWYELREEVMRTYRDDKPERIPLSRQKEFKQIRNIVIQEALGLNDPPPPGSDKTEDAPVRERPLSTPYDTPRQADVPSISRVEPVLSSATRLLRRMGSLFWKQSPGHASGPVISVDSKLRQKIRQKKIAMGHRPDDHEDVGIRME